MDVPMNTKPLLNDQKLSVLQMRTLEQLHIYVRPNNRSFGLRHAWKFESWSKIKQCGLRPPLGFMRSGHWRHLLPEKTWQAWEADENESRSQVHLDSSGPDCLGILSGFGPVCSSTWCHCASSQAVAEDFFWIVKLVQSWSSSRKQEAMKNWAQWPTEL